MKYIKLLIIKQLNNNSNYAENPHGSYRKIR